MIKQFVNLIFFRWSVSKHPPILIYQMGKVGSTSVYQSLKVIWRGEVFHTHVFDRKPHSSIYLRWLYKAVQSGKAKPLIISLVREPIGRNVSAFFQNFERDTGIPPNSEMKVETTELKQLFMTKFGEHVLPSIWFDQHIKATFGIDVFAEPFPASGWQMYRSKKAHLLVMKLEINDTIKEQALIDFLQLPFDLKIRNRNISEDKWYGNLYGQFKEQVKLDDTYLNEQLNSTYARHFYSESERELIRKRWFQSPD